MQKIAKTSYFHFIKLIYLMLFCFLSTTAKAGPVPFDKLVVFGDSLSDVGFTSQTSGGAAPCHHFYYEGRFSNGPAWIEHVAKALNFDTSTKEQFIDWAFGGTWAGDDISYDKNAVYKLSYEIEDYINEDSKHGEEEAKHLFVIWIGSNDYLSGNPAIKLEDATNDAINTIKKNMDLLIEDGARQFLILNLTDLGNTPKSRANGREYVERVTALSKLHNENLALMLKKQRENHPELKIVEIDMMPYFSDLMSNPQKYQLSNVTDYCYDGEYVCFENAESNTEQAKLATAKKQVMSLLKSKPYDKYPMTTIAPTAGEEPERSDWRKWNVCGNPDDYVYWDKLHPTAAVHRLLAGFVIERIKAEWNIS